MCDPIFGFGVAASGMAGTSSFVAATSGLFGTGGAFSIGTTLSTLSTAGSFLGNIMGGQQRSADLKYQAQMANYRATIDGNNALAAEYAAEYDRQLFEDKFRRTVIAKQAPGWAISGVVGTTGTPLMVAQETFVAGLREEDAILYGGQVASNANTQNALGQRFAASNLNSRAGSESRAGYINAGRSLLSGIA
jgi:hypothetical protein